MLRSERAGCSRRTPTASPPGIGRRTESAPGGSWGAHAVQPEGAPASAVAVESQQIPAVVQRQHSVWLDVAFSSGPLPCPVREANSFVVAASLGEYGECVAVHLDPRSCLGRDRGCHTVTRRRTRVGSTCSSLARARSDVSSIPRDRPTRRSEETDCDGRGLLLVEKQRWYFDARLEPVATVPATSRHHRVPEIAQALDVTPQRALAHPEPSQQLFSAPGSFRLQQTQKIEHSCGRVGHCPRLIRIPVKNCHECVIA